MELSERGKAKGNTLSNNHPGTFCVRTECPVNRDILDTEID